MGAWIEMLLNLAFNSSYSSPPVWGRGLKFISSAILALPQPVAPCMGAWIEIPFTLGLYRRRPGRPLYGGVD